jgi:ABC transporter substrate binding protein
MRENWLHLIPDVIMAFTSAAVAPLRQVTRTVPIVFAVVADPVGAGYVDSLAEPGGNVTGFAAQEYVLSGKSLELLKELVPQTRRVAVLRDSTLAAGPGQFGAIQALAPSLGVELRPIDLHDAAEIESAIAAFAKGPNNGLIVTASPSATLSVAHDRAPHVILSTLHPADEVGPHHFPVRACLACTPRVLLRALPTTQRRKRIVPHRVVIAMAITARLCRASAKECRRRAGLSIDPAARTAYQELVRAWLLLADTAEELAKLRRVKPANPIAKAA